MPKFATYPLVTAPAPTDLLLVKQGALTKGLPLAMARNVAWFNVRDYGAVGDGVADDTVAIQAAITAAGASSIAGGATVYLPAGFYRTTATLVFPDPEALSYYTAVSFLGDSSYTTVIKYDGPTTAGSCAIKAFGQIGTLNGRLTLRNITGSHGSAVGLYCSGNSPAGGTITNDLIWQDLALDQWFVGATLGGKLIPGQPTLGDASEIAFISPKITNCDTGLAIGEGSGNSITVNIYHLSAGQCGIVIDMTFGFNCNVYGGSVSEATVAAFYISQGTMTLSGLWIENSYFLTQRGLATVHCAGIAVADPPDTFFMDIQNGKATFVNCHLVGQWVIGNLAGGPSAYFLNCYLNYVAGTPLLQPFTDTYAFGAFPLNPSAMGSPNGLDRVEYAFKHCYLTDPDTGLGGPIPDQEGHCVVSGFEFWQYGRGLLATGQTAIFETMENPTDASLKMGGTGDQAAQKILGLYVKSGKFVLAYDLSNVVQYLSIPLDGSTVAWTHSTMAP